MILSRRLRSPEVIRNKDWRSRCQTQVFPGFDCLRGRATLDQLLRFDRPLLLELEHAGKRGLVLLRGVSGDTVRLDFAGIGYRLSIE